jgi:hypothetical protein
MDSGGLSLLTGFLLPLLWLVLGVAAFLFLTVLCGLLRSAAASIRPGGAKTDRLSISDTRFLRNMHIRL